MHTLLRAVGGGRRAEHVRAKLVARHGSIRCHLNRQTPLSRYATRARHLRHERLIYPQRLGQALLAPEGLYGTQYGGVLFHAAKIIPKVLACQYRKYYWFHSTMRACHESAMIQGSHDVSPNAGETSVRTA
jgi:hypothetical protein